MHASTLVKPKSGSLVSAGGWQRDSMSGLGLPAVILMELNIHIIGRIAFSFTLMTSVSMMVIDKPRQSPFIIVIN